ncbi:hypothetical protein NIES2100_70500 [Calothrix sp. NIES-2100]|nr:hypothetical protein NIES2100_70500 [Calothrix sp. NIES-2100]
MDSSPRPKNTLVCYLASNMFLPTTRLRDSLLSTGKLFLRGRQCLVLFRYKNILSWFTVFLTTNKYALIALPPCMNAVALLGARTLVNSPQEKCLTYEFTQLICQRLLLLCHVNFDGLRDPRQLLRSRISDTSQFKKNYVMDY